ncbi:MAG TPA: GntG family PLP-dependent aldolase [Actinomycetota bacterium]|jgi:threonine aldolase|nr:GntG family PLP-dependent aldolase [Actinomycetota bacterium]
MPIDLRSDTLTRPTPAMRRAMADAEVGDDQWREDPTTQRLEAAVAERFGREAALFVPSGTMGNQVCLRLAARPGSEVLANEDNHIFWYESGAAPALSGIQLHAVAGVRGRLDPAAVAARVRGAAYGVPTAAVAVEQTHNRGGGAVHPLAELAELRALTSAAGLHLHCDGARIWNASVATGTSLERYGAMFDSLSVCFSKGLAAPVGSAVIGDRELVERARQVRQLLGGGLRQSGVLAAAALVAIDEMVDRLADDHANARATAETVAAGVPGSTDPALVDTNIVLLDTRPFGTDGPGLVARLAEQDVLAVDTGPEQVRLVFHYEVGAGDAEKAARAIVAAAA